MKAQTVLINPSAEGGFELGTTFAANGWTVSNTAIVPYNAWWVGNAVTDFGTGNSAYVSDNISGTTHSYSLTQSNQIHFYRDVTFPAGEDFILLNFQVIVNGEAGGWDLLQVSIASPAVTPTGSTTYPGGGFGPIVPGASVLGNYFMLGTGVQNITIAIPSSLVGNCSAPSTRRIIFSWKNDNSLGTQPPAAIDNISLVSAPITPAVSMSPFTIDNTLPTAGTNFNNFNDAITWLNAAASSCAGITNAIVFNVTAGQTFTETPKFINATGTITNTITFQKAGAGANPVILATNGSGTNDAAITLTGSDYITFNGIDITDNPANVTTATQMEYGFLIRNASASDGAQNNTISNSTIILNRTNTATRAILQTASATGGGFIPTALSGANHNNTYNNIVVENSYTGIYLLGNATFPDGNCQINNSTIGGASSNDIGGGGVQTWGIRAQNQNNVAVNNNLIRNVSANAATIDGIFIEAAQGTATVSNNRVLVLRNLSTSSATSIVSGIKASLSGTGTHQTRIFNNFVSEMISAYTGTAVATRTLRGINILTGGTAGSTHNIHFNSVRIDGSASPNLSSTCFEIGTTSGPVMNVRNNIFANFTGAQSGVSKHYTWVSTSATLVGNTGSVSNYNDLYIANTTNGFVGLGNTTDRATLADWQTATSNDANSVSADPQFVSMFDLHASALAIHDAGTMTGISWVTTDIDGDIRNISTPDIGADEFTLVICSSANGGNINPVSYSRCDGQTVTLTSVGASNDIGISYQWKVSTTSGGPYSNVVGGTGATTTSYTSGPLSPGVYYYVLEVTCTPASLTGLSNEVTVTVNALPSVAVTPNSATYCNPGTPVALTASGANTYVWSPAAGLSSTTGDNVNASPTSSTVYTVTGTDANGCVNTATTNISVLQTPVLTSVTATPQNLCSGDDSQLQANPADFSYAIGSGTITNTATSYPAPYGNYWWGARHQMLIYASELTAAGLVAGPINSMALNVTALNGGAPLTNFQISMGHTAITTMTAWQTLSTVVYSVPSYTPVLGVNTHTFSTPFIWDGTSNIIIETCFNNSSFTNNASVSQSTTPYVSTIHYRADASGVCSNNSITGTFSQRPNIIFGQAPSSLVYNWTPATFLTSTTIANPIAQNVTSTTTYTVTAANGSCVSAPANVTVNVDALTLSISVLPGATVCEGTNVTLQSTVSGGGMPYTYAWTGPNGFTSSNANPVINSITTAAAGTYALTLTDNCGTILTENLTLTVNPNPIVIVTGSSPTYCNPGTPVTLTATGALTYSWSPAAGLSATTGDVVDATPIATTTYMAIGTDGNGCQGNASIAVNVVLTPVATPSATPAVICSGENSQLQANPADFSYAIGSGTITNTATSYPAPYGNYWWGARHQMLIYASELTAAGLVAGPINSMALNVTALNGGAPLTNFQISMGHTAITNMTAWQTLSTVVYSVPSYTPVLGVNTHTFSTPFVWDGTSNIIIETCFNNSSYTNNASVSQSTTPYVSTIHYRADASGVCSNNSISGTFSQRPNIVFGQTPVLLYNWSPAANLDNALVSNPIATPNSSETYMVTVTDPISGCSSDATVTVDVNPLPVNNLGSDTLLCGSSVLTLDAGNPGSTYLWSDNSTNQTLDVTADGNYSVEITEPVNGCSAIYDIDVTFGQLPAPVNLGNDTVVCNGGSIVLNAGSGYTTYDWNTGATSQTITATSAGTYSVVVTNNDGCEATDDIVITLGTNPTVNLGNDTTICIYNSITLDAGAGFSSYLWSTTATTQTIVILGSQGIGLYTYSVGVTDAFGCVGRDTIRITVDECLGVDELAGQSVNVVPNPNNGNFVINLENVNHADLKIFDMQGKLIYNERLNGNINRKEISIEKAERGVYMLQITSANNIFNQRIVIHY